MLHVTILAVGKLKERYLTDACGEYLKRLQAHCKAAVIEVEETRLPAKPSPADIERCVEAEGRGILGRLPKGARLVALCIEGDSMSSEAFADLLSGAGSEVSGLAFAIGGSHGLSDAVKEAAWRRVSLSRMTFPHQLTRVVLLEQIYRGFSIAGGGKYHK